MPRAPSYQPNQVAPASTTGARFNPANNNGGVVGGIASGMRELGGAIGDFAAAQDRIDEENDDTQARKLALEAGEQFDLAATEYGTLESGQAREKNQTYRDLIEKVKEDALAKAPTARARKFLDQRIAGAYSSTLTKITSHALTESKVEREQTFLAQRQSYVERAGATDDPQERERLIDSALAVTDDYLVQLKGIDPDAAPEVFENERLAVTSKVHGLVVDKMLAVANPSVDGVVAYLRAYEDEMTADLKADVLKSIQSPLQQRSARSGAQTVLDRVLGLQGKPNEGKAQEYKYVMPTKGSIPKGGRFHDSRDGGSRQHASLDISAPIGTPIYTTAPGKVTKVVPNGGDSGNWVEVTHPDGRTSTYSHMNGFSVKVGDIVAAGDQLGEVGNTGAGTGPHLHWVVKDKDGKRLDPEKVLGESGSGPSYGGTARNWDRARVLGELEKVAAENGWNQEETERVRVEVLRQVNAEEGLLREQYGDAADEATRIIAQLPNGLENINQIPRDLRNRMDPTDVAQLEQGIREQKRREAERKAKENASASNAQVKLTLQLMQRFEPEKFKEMNLLQYQGALSPSEFQSLFIKQQDMLLEKPKPYQPQERIGGAISRGKAYHGIEVEDEDKPAVYDFMEDYLRQRYEKNGEVTLNDADDALKAAMAVRGKRSSTFLGVEYSSEDLKAYEITYDAIPVATRNKIIRNWQGEGRPSKDDVLRIYRQMGN